MSLLAIPVAIFFGMLAFYKVNSQPFIKTVENFVSHYTRSRLFLWRKADRPEIKQASTAETAKKIGSPMPKLTESKLKELAWSLDIQKPPRRIKNHAKSNRKISTGICPNKRNTGRYCNYERRLVKSRANGLFSQLRLKIRGRTAGDYFPVPKFSQLS